MSQTAENTSTSVASHSCTFKAILSFGLLLVTSFNLIAQNKDSTNLSQVGTKTGSDSAAKAPTRAIENIPEWYDTFEYDSVLKVFKIKKGLPTLKSSNKKRVRTVAIANIAGYGGVMIGLNAAWYADFPRSSFHTFNDNKEWLQVDKVGHMYSAYIESRASMEMWRWTGIGRKKRIWLGGLSGAVYQTVIETLDGFSAEWGWSWGDFGANVLGSGTLIAQELAWNDQRIKLKFSFHKNDYGSTQLNDRADKLFGKTLAERFIKDYNAQTYWASANIKSFFPKSKLPAWLGVSVGYGASGMFGGTENIAKDDLGNITFDRTDIRRYRQWYLAPDIDLSKIKTHKKGVRFLLNVLSAFKFPTPSIEFSKGKFKLHVIHF